MEDDVNHRGLSRRQFLKSAVGLGLTAALTPWPLRTLAEDDFSSPLETMKTRPIPGTEENLPVIGVGTWQQFDVTPNPAYLDPLRDVLDNLYRLGGSVIDTSPMYGRAEKVLGVLMEEMGNRDRAFLATKVWTSGKQNGIQQMNQSLERLGVDTLDLMQVHNLVDWKTHLQTLNQWKKEGTIRYTGITHYTRSAFDQLESIMENRDVDFVQLPYSIGFRAAEDRLLPLARDRGIAVLVNRPFEAGGLIRDVRDKSLPPWAGEIDCVTWAQFFLKFVLGHPAVTCVIPGTSNPEHMLDNARAGAGTIPEPQQRKRMYEYWQTL